MKKHLLSLWLVASAAQADYTNLAGEPVQLAGPGLQHLVFVDIWQSYAGNGPEPHVAALSQSFQQQASTVWIALDINVTPAYVQDYQQAFPTSKPMLIDTGHKLMRRYQLWQTPAHVVLKDGETLFAGNGKALETWLSRQFPVSTQKGEN